MINNEATRTGAGSARMNRSATTETTISTPVAMRVAGPWVWVTLAPMIAAQAGTRHHSGFTAARARASGVASYSSISSTRRTAVMRCTG